MTKFIQRAVRFRGWIAVSLTFLVTVLILGALPGAKAAPPTSQGVNKAPVMAQSVKKAGGKGGGHVAAKITYRRIPRPEWVPDSFQPPPGVHQRFFTINALDGFDVDAVLFERGHSRRARADTTLVVRMHGSGGNYTEQPFLGPGLSQHGYSYLAINTRQHDQYVNTDNFLNIRTDIQSAVLTAESLGYKRIVLAGHSLGSVQVLYYAASAWDPHIKAVILDSMFANLPWKSRNILIQDEPIYHQLYQEAIQAVRSGHPERVLPTEMPYLHGRSTPVTARHFLTYRWQATSVAVSINLIKQVPHPILLIRGTEDTIIRPFEPNELLAAANSEGTLVESIKYVKVPGTGHGYEENPKGLIDAYLNWLEDQNL